MHTVKKNQEINDFLMKKTSRIEPIENTNVYENRGEYRVWES